MSVCIKILSHYTWSHIISKQCAKYYDQSLKFREDTEDDGSSGHFRKAMTFALGWLSCSRGKWGFPGGSDGEESAHNKEDPDLTPGSGRSPGEGNGNPLQYSRLENSMDRETWQATVHGIAVNQTWLSNYNSYLLEENERRVILAKGTVQTKALRLKEALCARGTAYAWDNVGVPSGVLGCA